MRRTTRILLSLALAGALVLVSALSLWPGDVTQVRAQSDDTPQGTMDVQKAASRMNGQPVAVIELFTSEGCSSCPPADANLSRISKTREALDGRVIPLSFHVDYWNYLGWEDPFSQTVFSERQRDYARGAKQKGVYTPQMVVNGKYAFNGSDEASSDKAIDLALRQPVIHVVELTVTRSKTDDRFVASYSVRPAETRPESGPVADHIRNAVATENVATDADSDFQIIIAVASESEFVKVVRGENGGRELSHAWVVKRLDVRPLSEQNHRFEFDAAIATPGQTRVVAYVQSRSSREITGAVAVNL